MADGSVRAAVSNGVAKAQPFFAINASYVVAEGAEPDDLLADIPCLAECAEGALQAIIDGLSTDGSQMQANPRDVVRLAFGVMYQVQMMANLAGAAEAQYRRSASEVPNG